jgi:hypothetical protein
MSVVVCDQIYGLWLHLQLESNVHCISSIKTTATASPDAFIITIISFELKTGWTLIPTQLSPTVLLYFVHNRASTANISYTYN